MRIGIDYRPVTAAPFSGIAKQVLAMERAVLESKHSLTRFTACPQQHPHRETCLCPNVETPIETLHRPKTRWQFEASFLGSAIQSQTLDLYIATANMGLPILRRPPHTRLILLLHDVFQLTMQNKHGSRLKYYVYRALDWLSIGYSVTVADHILTPSQFSANQICQLFPGARGKISVLYNAVPQTSTTSALPRTEGLPTAYWLVVGTREPRKNIPWFISHWAQLRGENASVPDLVLVGTPEDTPESLRNLNGLHHQHHLTEQALSSLYVHADYVWQPSLAEGFGLPVIEALGHATPVAVATGSALDEVAPPSALRFSPTDAHSLRRAMLEAIAHPKSAHSENEKTTLRDWAKQFDQAHYQDRLIQCLEGWLVK